MTGPLTGIRVIDLTTVIAGPFATQMLGDMGADVLKVEPPSGDIMRAPGPFRTPGMGASFLNCNRNKESLKLDLRSQADRDVLLALIAEADVFVHNMRMEAARRAGLDPDALLSRNPRLIYCAVVGYGQDGPYRDRPAYDDVIQAASGWAELGARNGDEPRYAPTIAADKITGLFAASAINAALYSRSVTGQGQAVEVPMFEAMAAFLAVEHLAGRSFVPPNGTTGYSRILSPHRRPYRSADGYIAVLPYTAAHWGAFFRAAGREDWAIETETATNGERAAMVGQLYEKLAGCLLERSTADWLAMLEPLQIPCSPVNAIDDLLEDPHLKAVGLFEEVTHPTEGALLNVRHPVRFSATPAQTRKLAPPLKAEAPRRE